MELNQPLVLEGAVAAALAGQVGAQECVPRWLLQHADRAAQLQKEYLQAGAHLLCAPTGGVQPLALSDYQVSEAETGAMNGALVKMTEESAAGRPVAAIISAAGHLPEPYGPLPYSDLADLYAQQALELKEAGAGLLVLCGMKLTVDIRAAVLGARQARLPILALLTVGEEVENAPDPLSVLLCLQELGIAAFGVTHADPVKIPACLKRMAPYAKVPLAAGVTGGEWAPEALALACFDILGAGARILLGGEGVCPQHIKALRKLVDGFDYSAFPLPDPAKLTPVVLTDEERAYYLEEGYQACRPIKCSSGLSAEILQAREQGSDLLLLRVRDIQDAITLNENTHIVGMPVGLLAETPEALEAALLLYGGRALVDTRSQVPPVTLEALAGGYGAVLGQPMYNNDTDDPETE